MERKMTLSTKLSLAFALSLLLLTMKSATWAQSGTLSVDSFGFQCAVNSNNCLNYVWPPTQAQPGVFRLWDASVQWNVLNPGNGSYNFNTLSHWLDTIAQNQPRIVIYTFGWTPTWLTTVGCITKGCAGVPSDFDPTTGSPAFNNFVSQLVGYCNSNGHCVKDYIQYFELWNEANSTTYWAGTVTQLYQMMKPAVGTIRTAIPAAKILTPPISTAGTYKAWMQSWIGLEVGYRLSDFYAFHNYLADKTPEQRIADGTVQNQLYANFNTTGWTPLPWLVTETNYDPSTLACETPTPYTVADCTGQILRWQLILNSNGAVNLSWYAWLNTMNEESSYEPAYYWMMHYLQGGTLTAPCAFNNTIQAWDCPFTEGNSTLATFVWSPAPNSPTFNVPAGYVDYVDMSTGHVTPVSTGQPVTLGVEPYLFEK